MVAWGVMAKTSLQTKLRPTHARSPLRLTKLARRYAPAVALFLVLMLALELGLPALGVPAFLLPTPSRVLARLLEPSGELFRHAAATGAAALIGLLLGALAGAGLAAVFVRLRPLEQALYPWVLLSQSLPAAALAPLLTIWLGNGLAPRAAMAALFAFFPVLVSFSAGLRRVRREELDLMRAWGATPGQVFWHLRLPAGLPGLLSGLKVAAALAVAGAIVGELAGAGRGLGYAITVAAYHLRTDTVFAAVALAAALSLGLHAALAFLERRVIFWQQEM